MRKSTALPTYLYSYTFIYRYTFCPNAYIVQLIFNEFCNLFKAAKKKGNSAKFMCVMRKQSKN